MTQDDRQESEAALNWLVRLRDPGADWEAFTAWLEADPRRNALYEQAALADRAIGEALAAPRQPLVLTNDNAAIHRRPVYRRRAGWLAAAAAALIVAVTGYPLLHRGDGTYDVTTALGEQRRVVLADGTRIEMNGATRLILHHGDTRLASLADGEATFTVVHDAAHPFAVQVGANRIEDVGTVFDVANVGRVTEIGVAEGAVVYNPQAEAVTLTAGQTLQVAADDGRLVSNRVAPDAIGMWRRGRLVYQGARIDHVAADVSRYLGVSVSPDPAIAGRTFDGVIVLDHDPQRLFARLAPLLDVTAQPSEGGWRLTSLKREPR